MARSSFQARIGANLGEGQFSISAGSAEDLSVPTGLTLASVTSADNAAGTADTDAGTANGTLKTNVANAVAVLVADGASPTQAHVTTLNNAWGLLNTAIGTAKTSTAAAKVATAAAKVSATTTDTAASANNVVVSVDTAVATSINHLKRAFDALLLLARGSGKFTD